MTVASVKGMFKKNNERQPSQSTNTPPIDGPSAAAMPPVAPQIAMACVRFSTGNSGKTSASEAGESCAPPKACTTRAPTRNHALGATPHNNEPRLNHNTPRRKLRLRPNTSANRPAVSNAAAYAMAYAENTQVSRLPPPRSSAIDRLATTTIDKSSDTRNTDTAVSASTR